MLEIYIKSNWERTGYATILLRTAWRGKMERWWEYICIYIIRRDKSEKVKTSEGLVKLLFSLDGRRFFNMEMDLCYDWMIGWMIELQLIYPTTATGSKTISSHVTTRHSTSVVVVGIWFNWTWMTKMVIVKTIFLATKKMLSTLKAQYNTRLTINGPSLLTQGKVDLSKENVTKMWNTIALQCMRLLLMTWEHDAWRFCKMDDDRIEKSSK